MGRSGAILVVEDDVDIAASLEMILAAEDYSVTVCHDGRDGLAKAGEGTYDLVMTDLRLPGMGGMELLETLREKHPLRPVILMTAHGNSELAIEAIKRGAYDYVLKPFDLEDLLKLVAEAVRASKSAGSESRRSRATATSPKDPGLLGRSRGMLTVWKDIGRIAPTDTSVLILGETGTGKELVARAICHHSARRAGPFVVVNCGAIPENLLESELFGHVRGAFTGATRDRVGRFEQAKGGTLFLDEIGDLPLPVQVKLLRALQERRIQPLGSNRELPVDVRIIAATHQPLAQRIEEKRFREDLYYRINAAVIQLPALREREGDVELLIAHFLEEAAADYQLPRPAIPARVMNRLLQHEWPGNVRELRNAVRQIALRSRGYEVTTVLVEAVLGGGVEQAVQGSGTTDFDQAIRQSVLHALEEAQKSGKGEVHRDLVERLERSLIRTALTLSDSHLGQVCDWLGISRVTLRKKMQEHGFEKADTEPPAQDAE
ncbi:two-component system nitrogen regulation response regulator GlnG [Roseimicrobium gellanilyticum]|uniref:Two-component system nitrogen regulation response regulator GlnG n=1 Tax=Roseimicrobium gellanilyticum TaxID=748857 RepID=A0A366H5J6_9BACT|nr:sigma-54 dependent transcriptional regulator [Roseimicrobium gellanilyticum]RBP36644.1 two-component system nitrogen regulation response regulator GlnG [Roseimicrobium gellanilyticum]